MTSKILGAWIGFLLVAIPALARTPYEVLGVPKTATQPQIEAAFDQLSTKSTTTLERANLLANFLALSDPEKRARIDAGQNLDLLIADEDRKSVAALIQGVNPQAAQQVLQNGRVNGGLLSGTLGFYMASTLSQYWKCVRTDDPDYCALYIHSLKDWKNYAGFGLFMGASAATSRASLALLTKLSKGGKISKSVLKSAEMSSQLLGLSAGMMVNEIFSEIIDHPDFQKMEDSAKIRDPVERKKQHDEAEQALWKDTFGNAGWWGEKAPMIAGGAIGASLLTGGTLSVLGKGVQKVLKTKSDSRWVRCLQQGLGVLVSPAKSAKMAFIQKGALNIGQMLVYFGYATPATNAAQAGWDRLTSEPKLAHSRIAVSGADPAASAVALKKLLDQNDGLWDTYRRSLMSSADQVLGAHAFENGKMTAALGRPLATYHWILDGMKEDDDWSTLQDLYYSSSMKPKDIRKDVMKYLHGFFCGPAPASAFNFADKGEGGVLHRLAVPVEAGVKVQPYQVVAPSDPSLCSAGASLEELKAAALDPSHNQEYQDKLTAASDAFDTASTPDHQKQISMYEESVQKSLVSSLAGQGTKDSGKLPAGVLSAFDAQLADLGQLRSRLATDKDAQASQLAVVDAKVAAVQKKRKAAQDLYDYISEPASKRSAPKTGDSVIASFLSGVSTPDGDASTQQVVDYFNGFILR